MKTRTIMILLSLGLAGCSVSTEKFDAPTGKTGYIIKCEAGKDCYKQARSKCPEGYTTIKSPTGELTRQDGTRVVIECN